MDVCEGNGYSLQYSSGFPPGSDGKEYAYSTGDLDSILCWEDPLE